MIMAKDRRAEHKAYREKNKERTASAQAAWRAEHPTYGKEWYAANKERWVGYRETQKGKPCATPS